MTQFTVKSDEGLNPELKQEVQTLRSGILHQSERILMPERFMATPHEEKSVMVVTDSVSGKTFECPLFAFKAVKECLAEFFG